MNFGSSTYGNAQYGGDPYGLGPASIIDLMIDSMSEFLQSEGGVIKKIDRLTIPIDSPELLELVSMAGSPAIFISYDGCRYAPDATDKLTARKEMQFSVICVCSKWNDRKSRFEGRNIYQPNLDNITRWAVNRITRKIIPLSTIKNFLPTEEKYIHYSPENIMSITTFTGTTVIDFFDDEDSPIYVERIGLVHTPNNLNQLFDLDNETPNSEDDTSASPGVYPLEVD